MSRSVVSLALAALTLLAAAQSAAAAKAAAPASPPASAPDVDALFAPLKWRSIGPFRGGRSNASTGVIGDPKTYYSGFTGGGLWKTHDMGITWRNISDGYFATGTVGAVAVAPSDSNVLYVGMGEHAIRGVMTHSGDGVYGSTDAGKTWKHLGLERTRHVSRIVVDPRDAEVVYVAAQGALYGPSTERGIYKSTDGGATWRRTLFVDEKTGASELSLDPTNPRILYAAMWQHGRRPWYVESGGPGSGLYKSTDRGETWQKLTDGLPEKMGKMAIAVSPSKPDRVWALIESESTEKERGLYVSENGGKKWRLVTNEPQLVQRAWYYIELFVDPQDSDTIYVLSAPALRSTDGGKTWDELHGTHGDFHDLWINPDDSDNFVISNDGGPAISFDGGKSWSTQANLPTAQFYRISVDNQFPYRIYGGQQDNSSVVITSRELGSGGITTEGWTSSAGGESAFLAFDPDDPRFVMGGSYQGTIDVLDTNAKAGTNVMAAPIQYLGMDAKDMKYRFNWNAPILRSRHEPDAYFHAAQVLLKTTDFGKSWREVSPDLTRNERDKQGKAGGPYTNEGVGAENYGTIAYAIESPHEKGVLWTGSDDGLVHLTRDGGATWKNVTPRGLAECLVNAIEVSPFDQATAYIATTRYKFDDHAPGLYKTTDYGATWTKIDRGIPAHAFTRVVREDDVRRDLLFAGTEVGLFVSWNGGQSWAPFQRNLPVTPITDLRVHQGDLIASTSGRSFWVLDDLEVVRQYQGAPEPISLYRPADAYLVNGWSDLDHSDEEFTGAHPHRGVNPATGIVLYYHLPELAKTDDVTLEVTDSGGKLVRSYSSKAVDGARTWDGGPPLEPVLPKAKGLNRFVWDLRHPTLSGVPDVYIEGSYRAHKAVPGSYRFTLKQGDRQVATEAAILPNPLYSTSAATYAEYHVAMSQMESALDAMHRRVNTLFEQQQQLAALLGSLPADEKFAAVKKDGEALLATLKAWDEEMIQRYSKAYDDVENFPNKFTANYFFVVNQAESDLPRINQAVIDRRAELEAQWSTLKSRSDDLLDRAIPELNAKLWAAGIGAIWKK